MTFLGKLMVVLNVVLSLAILAAALASFANPVDFSDNAAKDGRPEGIFKERTKLITEAWDKINKPLRDDETAQAALKTLEVYQTAHAWYAAELQKLEIGGPVKEIRLNGQVPDLDPADYSRVRFDDIKAAGEVLALKPRQEYEQACARIEKQLRDAEDALLVAIRKDISETMKRLRLKDPAGNEELGLHLRLTDEEFKLLMAREELARVKPLFINALVESQLIVERRLALESRLQELKKLEKSVEATQP